MYSLSFVVDDGFAALIVIVVVVVDVLIAVDVDVFVVVNISWLIVSCRVFTSCGKDTSRNFG